MKHYTLEAVEKLMNQYLEKGGEVITIDEGSLGWGKVVCIADGYKNAIITEVFVNEWSSSHTVRFCKKLSDKLQKQIDLLT